MISVYKCQWSHLCLEILIRFSRIDRDSYLLLLLGDGSVLDTWVFEKFTLLLEQAKTDEALYKKLHSDKIVFFLHLLGLDTNGHSHLPTSEFYLNNIRIVDDGIKKVTEQLREFYGDDGKTSYVFTADHGMGNRGERLFFSDDKKQEQALRWQNVFAKQVAEFVLGI